ncbi:hypothetical protein K8R66_04135, partial [bacterium]|nr:hypothetical protein [bacterium]
IYQASYWGGDSSNFQSYIPTAKGLLIYSYNVAPKENDPDYFYHEQVTKNILSSLEFEKVKLK